MNKVDILIHTAGIANALPNTNIKEEYFEVNSELTRKVALIASKYDVKINIYKFNKSFDNSDLKKALFQITLENPKDIYGKSKLKAENYLKKASAEILLIM